MSRGHRCVAGPGTYAMAGLLLLAASALPPSASHAQDKPVPPPVTVTPDPPPAKKKLPGLTLPQYVITGIDDIGFPLDAKLLPELLREGDFAERAGRGVREAHTADVSALRRPLDLQPLDGVRTRLRARLGLGRFTTPFADIRFADRYAASDISAHAGYEQGEGHVDGADYSRGSIGVTAGTHLPAHAHPLLARSRVEVGATLTDDRYGLYADRLTFPAPALTLRRSLTSLSWGGSLRSRLNRVIDHDAAVRLDHTLLRDRMSVSDSLDLGHFDREEHTVLLHAGVRTPIGGYEVAGQIDAALSAGATSTDNPNRPVFVHASAGSRFSLFPRTALDAGVHFWLFRGSASAAAGRLYPMLRLTHHLDDDYSVFVGFEPSVERRSLARMFQDAPYLSAHAEVRHDDMPIRVRLGGEWDDRRRASARVILEHVYGSSYFRPAASPSPLPQVWRAQYTGGVTVTALTADAHVRLGKPGRLHGTLIARSSTDDVTGNRVAYLPGVEASLRYEHSFAFGLLVGTAVRITAARADDVSDLPSLIDGAIELEYAFTSAISALLVSENFFNQTAERWRGYSQRPFFVGAGVVVRL